MLEDACRSGGDLAKMVTLSIERRITIDKCYASSTFPVLPDTLPLPVAQISAQAPPSLTSRTAQTKPRGFQMNANVFTAAQYRVEKARDPLQAKPFRRLPEIRPKPKAKN